MVILPSVQTIKIMFTLNYDKANIDAARFGWWNKELQNVDNYFLMSCIQGYVTFCVTKYFIASMQTGWPQTDP